MSEGEEYIIELPEALILRDIKEFFESHKDNILSTSGSVVIKAANVKKAATPAIQFVVSIKKTSEGGLFSFKLDNPSSEFKEACGYLGLWDFLKGEDDE